MLRVQTEAFQGANVALGQMKAAALPAPSAAELGGAPVGVAGSIPSTPDAIAAGRDATPPHLQQVSGGLVRAGGGGGEGGGGGSHARCCTCPASACASKSPLGMRLHHTWHHTAPHCMA